MSSLIFYPTSKEDTLATITLAVAISSRLISIKDLNELPIFAIYSSALALILSIIFAFISWFVFYLWDTRDQYKGRYSWRYAWDHINYYPYRVKFVSYLRLATAAGILLLPPTPYYPFGTGILKMPFFYEDTWYGSSTVLVIGIIFILLVVLLFIHGQTWRKRLQIVRLFNTLGNWNDHIRPLIKDNSWEEVFAEMEKIRITNYKQIDDFLTSLKKMKEEIRCNFDNILGVYILMNDEKDWKASIIDYKLNFSFLQIKDPNIKNSQLVPYDNENVSKELTKLSQELLRKESELKKLSSTVEITQILSSLDYTITKLDIILTTVHYKDKFKQSRQFPFGIDFNYDIVLDWESKVKTLNQTFEMNINYERVKNDRILAKIFFIYLYYRNIDSNKTIKFFETVVTTINQLKDNILQIEDDKIIYYRILPNLPNEFRLKDIINDLTSIYDQPKILIQKLKDFHDNSTKTYKSIVQELEILPQEIKKELLKVF